MKENAGRVTGLLGALVLTVTPGVLPGQTASPPGPRTGAVAGTVIYRGPPPAPRSLEVRTDREFCGSSVPDRNLIVRGGKVANAVVFLEGIPAPGVPAADPPGKYLLSNVGCRFEPRVMAARAGGILVVENGDAILHNTNLTLHYGGLSRMMANMALPRAGMRVEKPQVLRLPGLIEVKCDVHGWMRAKIRVFDHPYFAVTGEDGSFTIPGLPVGQHTLTVWHEVLGEQTREITVERGGLVRVELAYGPAG